MKRTSLSVILVVSLLGSPAPVQAANGMADMMSIMMEMFLWMMRGASSGGGFGGINPYSIGGPGLYGNPMLANSLPGNPLLGGYQQGWGNMLPYGTQGMYSPQGYSGLASSYNPYSSNPYSSNPYSSQYGIPYYPGYYGSNTAQGYGYRPYYQQAYSNPFYPYRYNLNSRDTNSYKGKRYSQPDEYNHRNSYNNYGSAAGHANGQTAPVVIQPIIVSPTPHPSTTQPEGRERDQYSGQYSGQYPDQYPAIVNAPLGVPAAPLNAEPAAADDHDYSEQSWNSDNPLYGEWQGINGEYMNLAGNQFHLRSGETDLQGTYQVKNSILKAEIPNRAEPVYMQYRLDDGYLMFLSEDGQKMLFRRFP